MTTTRSRALGQSSDSVRQTVSDSSDGSDSQGSTIKSQPMSFGFDQMSPKNVFT